MKPALSMLMVICLVGAQASTAVAQSARVDTQVAPIPGQSSAIYNVLDHGADRTGKADFSAAFQSLASSLAQTGGVILFPPGTYRFSVPVFVGDGTAIETGAGTRFIGAFPNTLADNDVMAQGQAASSMQRLSLGAGNAWTTYLSQVQGQSGGNGSYEKGALYAGSLSYDPSRYVRSRAFDTMTAYKDAVGAELRATIAPGNRSGRVWGATTGGYVGADADGLVHGLEVDISSDAAAPAQGEYNRFNSKQAVGVYNLGSKQVTTGVLVSSPRVPFFDGVTVTRQAVTRNAFQLIDLSRYPARASFAVDASGAVTARSLMLAPYTFATLPPPDAAGREIFCSDCLKPNEKSGRGTGMMLFDDGHMRWISTAGTIAAR